MPPLPRTSTIPSSRGPRSRPVILPLVVIVGALAVLATLLAPSSGATSSASAPATASRSSDPSKDYPYVPKKCLDSNPIPQTPQACRLVWRGPNKPTLVLWGDSHAWQQIPGIRRAVGHRQVNLVAFLMGSCPPVRVDEKAIRERGAIKCEKLNQLALKYVTDLKRAGKHPKVLLGSAWAAYRDQWTDHVRSGDPMPTDEHDAFRLQMSKLAFNRTPLLFDLLGRRRIDVDVIQQGSYAPPSILPPCRAGTDPYACDFPRRKGIPDETRHRRWLRGQMSKLAGTPSLIDVNDAVCSPRTCHGKIDGIFTFFDAAHFSATRAATFTRFFVPSVKELLSGR